VAESIRLQLGTAAVVLITAGPHSCIAVIASVSSYLDLSPAVALERRVVVADRGCDPSQRARALAQAAKSAFALNDREASRAYAERARGTLTGDEPFGLELDIHQAALDLWSDGRQQLGQALARDAGHRHGGCSRPTSMYGFCIWRRCGSNTRPRFSRMTSQ
jgi:hypothetical protein